MEGDAKGQVGGMEMPQKERERLAQESRVWKCNGCGGRTNADILKEEGGDPEKGKQSEPVVPEDLKFGFKDEMDKAVEESKSEPKETLPQGATSADIGGTVSSGAQASTSMAPQNPSSAHPPQPTRTTSLNASVRPLQPAQPPMQQIQSNGVPRWVDNAITGLVAALILMVFKKIVV